MANRSGTSILMINLIVCGMAIPKTNKHNNLYSFPFVTRYEWGARPSGIATSELIKPVPYVVIHHSFEPPACYSRDTCVEQMQYMQDLHQLKNGWQDIGYNFAVGGDGAVYEGRGWNTVGAHASGFNSMSIGIVLIGDWIASTPPANQIEVAKKLIVTGVELGHISQDYHVVGHRQVGATECPGDALYNEITSWDNFVSKLKR